MEKKILTYDDIIAMDMPNIIAYMAPVMVALVFLEWAISTYKYRNGFYDGKDTLAAAAVGFLNILLSIAIKVVTFGIILFCYNLVPWTIPTEWWTFIACFIWVDFWRYWAHRVAHESRFWWATHVTHHSSDKYNLSVSFRLGWTQYLKLVFFLPVVLAGFDPLTFFICHQLAVLYQFWIHTEYIPRLPWLVEYIFVTPTNHKVHHATNEKYIDRNYGSSLIIWDRIFGTFQELEEHPSYGITKPLTQKYNPVYLCFHEWMDIVRDVRNAKSFREAWHVTFASPTLLAKEEEERAMQPENEQLQPEPVRV